MLTTIGLLLLTSFVIAKPATDLEKAICECCKEKDKTQECDDKTIADFKKASHSYDKCSFKFLNHILGHSGRYTKRKNDINVEEFTKWCNKIINLHKGYYVDAFALSWTAVDWSDNLKTSLYDAMYDKENMENYDITHIDRLIECTSVKFWNDFYNQVTMDKNNITTCFQFLYECYYLFSAYMYGNDFKKCSGSEVKGYIDAIKAGLPEIERKNIVKRIGPRSFIRFSAVGLISRFCWKEGHMSYIHVYSFWNNSQIKLFFFLTANFYWPITMTFEILRYSVLQLPVDIPNEIKYEHKNDAKSLDGLLNLINRTCVSVEVQDGVLIDYKYWWDDYKPCIETVIKIKKLNLFYNLPNDVLQELSTYNYFDLFNSKKFAFNKNKLGNPKNPSDILKTMKFLQKHNAKIYPAKNYPSPKGRKVFNYITKELIDKDDEQMLGIRSIINFTLLYRKCCIDYFAFQDVLGKFGEISKSYPINKDVKSSNVIKREDYEENDDPNSLYNIRKDFGYQPVFDTINEDENEWKWGKIVFVTIHATAIRYNAGLIRSDQVLGALIQCVEHLLQDLPLLNPYCGLFTTNPLFGEFDNIIRDKYVTAKLEDINEN